MSQRSAEYKRAQKRVKQKKEFFQHLSSYIVMSLFFVILNMLTSPDTWWFYWPMLGWGLGLVMHYVTIFGFPGLPNSSKDWEQKQLEKELGRNNSKYLPESDDSERDDQLELDKIPQKEKQQQNWDEEDLV